jgi:hypothetical protein
MSKLRSQLWHRLGRRQVTALTFVAALDGLLLIALGYGVVTAKSELVLLVAPTYSVLFMVLACSLAVFAERGLVSWHLVSGILLIGPLGAAVALRLCRRSSSR